MLHADERFTATVESTVAEIERETDAEIVVVAAGRSGTYRDLSFGAAGVASLGSLGMFLFVPWDLHPIGVLVETILVWGFAAWFLDGARAVRWLSRASRRTAQVEQAAAAEFHLEAVHATPDRTGLLVYVSALEGQVVLIPDVGLEQRIPRGAFAQARRSFDHDDLDHFVAGLRAVGKLLATNVPKRVHDAVDLPNAPRIRP